jgi:hypothetical protein
LEQFKSCFGHRAQLLSLRTYVHGVFSDSERKSMQAMLALVTEPVSYRRFNTSSRTRPGTPIVSGVGCVR